MKNINKLIITLCAITFSTLSHADKFTVKYRSCYDGDTCTVHLLKNAVTGARVLAFFGDGVKIRLAGIDTPEIKGECLQEKRLAKEAKRYLNDRLKQANSIIVDISKRDSFGRYLAVLYVDDININNLLLTRGYARVEQKGYHNWCK